MGGRLEEESDAPAGPAHYQLLWKLALDPLQDCVRRVGGHAVHCSRDVFRHSGRYGMWVEVASLQPLWLVGLDLERDLGSVLHALRAQSE